MVDDKFSVWDLKDAVDGDDDILKRFGVNAEVAGAGAADPKAIDFLWHQRNFEEAINALRNDEKPLVAGHEGRRAVELICAIYKSAQNGGEKVTL